jgi:ornithine decarboxylase
MALGLVRSVSPLRRRFDAADRPLPTIDDIVVAEQPIEPLHCLRPRTIAATARGFCRDFPGDAMYAVKCNPEPRVLRALWSGGIRHFDCASLREVALVREMFPQAAIHYMHPVKSRQAIAASFLRYGVRDFALDSFDELAKILDETGHRHHTPRAPGLGLIVRLAVPNTGAAYDLSGKFGAPADEAARLLAAARPFADRLGVCFHVGSQCLAPAAYRDAIRLAADAVARAGVPLDIVDVGGGFPVAYADTAPPPLAAYFAEIEAALHQSPLGRRVRLWAEPGRALVAAGISVVVQVLLRKGDHLYVNDGIYGSLSDAGLPGFRFPVRHIPAGSSHRSGPLVPFSLFGPTCDAADRMHGPFPLPDSVREGDWIEIGQLGAYGSALRTGFNGFDHARLVDVADPPMLGWAQPAGRRNSLGKRTPKIAALRGHGLIRTESKAI